MSWDGEERRYEKRTGMDEFIRYKELILSEINTLKGDFKDFKEDVYGKINTMQVTIATINTKLMTGSALMSFVVATIIAVVSAVIK
jgi:hypothetical protein